MLDDFANGGHFPDVVQEDSLVGGSRLNPQEEADLIASRESLAGQTFLPDPDFSDPWPKEHPAVAHRLMP